MVFLLAAGLTTVACGGGAGAGWPPAARDLQRATLTVDDMPSGWEVVDDGGDDSPPCGNRLAELLGLDADELPTARFSASANEQFGPSLLEQVAVLPPDAPDDLLGDFADAYLSCDEDIGGYPTTYAELPFDQLGDESFALRITVVDEAADRFFDHVFVRVGDVFVGLQAYDQFGDSTALLATYAPLALERAIDR